jgi:hypothetical protein
LSWGKEADPRQCWFLAEVVCCLEATDMSHCPCSTKGKYSQSFRQGQHWKSKPESKDIREETKDVLGVQQGNKLPRCKTSVMSADVKEIRWELQETHMTGDGESSSWVYNWSARCKRLDILGGPATSHAQEGSANSVGKGRIGTLATL